MLREVLASLRVVVFPPRCACELERPLDVEPPYGLCDGCLEALESAPHGDDGSAPIAPYEYGGPIASVVIAAKFRRRRDSARALGQLLAEYAPARDAARSCQGIVPVPLSPLRHWSRGFNQAELIAERCGRAWGLPVARVLRRTRETRPQSDLPRSEREANLRGAFSALRRLEGRWIVIDDVSTTGATLRAASEALRAAGASAVVPMAVCASA